MSESWAQRQRSTNRLARRLAKHVLFQPNVTARQLYGLSKLAWITRSYLEESASYIKSTKIPALEDILGHDFSRMDLQKVGKRASELCNDRGLAELVVTHTGFTNFYNAYRKSSIDWIEENIAELVPLYRLAFTSKNSEQRKAILARIQRLSGIPKPDGSEKLKVESFLTPTFFMLDPQIKFPIINGRESVKKLLVQQGVAGSNLVSQYEAMVSFYGKSGIQDAADLDQIDPDELPEFVPTPGANAKRRLLENKDTDAKELPLKDESDINAIIRAGTRPHRRIHNQLTNKLREVLCDYLLTEGLDDSCMYDVLVKNYDGKSSSLLVEAKSSLELSQIRMAVGQIYSYWFELGMKDDMDLALLLPGKPDDKTIEFLTMMDIGVIWFDGQELYTCSDWIQIST